LINSRREVSPSWPGKSAKRVFALDVPAIHVFDNQTPVMDARHKAGHDDIFDAVALW
jgi:hypothetical protein